MAKGESNSLPFADRADYYREQASRALTAAKLAVDPVARASLYDIVDAWDTLADSCDREDEPPSVLEVADLVEPPADRPGDEGPGTRKRRRKKRWSPVRIALRARLCGKRRV